jgi:zinc/manganese transport system substrate-binding protein
MKQMKKSILFIGCLFVAINCQAALQVVTSTEDVAAITRAVGGPLVDVVSLTPGTRDPHFAEAKPSMIRKVYRADLLILIGADMEIGWLPSLLQSARNGKVQKGRRGYLDLSSSIPLLGKTHGPVSRAMGDVHADGNPHYWLDPQNGGRMARAISARLEELDPENGINYRTQLKSFEQELKQKSQEWHVALAPLRGRSVIAYHTSLVYLAKAFGFTVVDEVEPKPGIAPSAGHLNQLVKRIKNENIGLLIMEPYYEQRSARYLNEKTGIRLSVLPQSVGATPQITTYFELFDRIAAILASQGKQ